MAGGHAALASLLFLARPGYNGNHHMEAVVVDSTANSIVVEDLTGDLFEALGPEGRPIAGFVPSRGSTGASLRSVSLRSIFAFNDSKQANAPTYQTQGTWTSAPSFASSQTTFTDVDADDNGGGFASWMIGAMLVPDVNIGAPLIITGATATTLTVAGDARGVASSGSQYIVYAAPFVNPTHGAWQTDPHKGGTRYLWAGYRYQPPQMGFWVDPPGAAGLGVYGASTGTNRLGQYYCWNRLYDVNLGRWTTPDPLAQYDNLQIYINGKPAGQIDATGLKTLETERRNSKKVTLAQKTEIKDRNVRFRGPELVNRRKEGDWCYQLFVTDRWRESWEITTKVTGTQYDLWSLEFDEDGYRHARNKALRSGLTSLVGGVFMMGHGFAAMIGGGMAAATPSAGVGQALGGAAMVGGFVEFGVGTAAMVDGVDTLQKLPKEEDFQKWQLQYAAQVEMDRVPEVTQTLLEDIHEFKLEMLALPCPGTECEDWGCPPDVGGDAGRKGAPGAGGPWGGKTGAWIRGRGIKPNGETASGRWTRGNSPRDPTAKSNPDPLPRGH
ncbi:MAG: hypothetical protein BroJett014_20670 [Planctomycetota bacterium]|nr:MAG: hypothetical protein BroJett014_20670 [Planctomycetota bacterium]